MPDSFYSLHVCLFIGIHAASRSLFLSFAAKRKKGSEGIAAQQ